MTIRYRSWDEIEIELHRERPEEIPLYLDVALDESRKDGDWGAFLRALRTVVAASVGLDELAQRLGCDRASLDAALDGDDLSLAMAARIFGALGLRLGASVIEEDGEEEGQGDGERAEQDRGEPDRPALTRPGT